MDDDFRVVTQVQIDRIAGVLNALDLAPTDLFDDVALLEPRHLSRRTRHHLRDDGVTDGDLTRDHQGQREQEHRQHEVHEGAGAHDDQTLPRRLGQQTTRVGVVLLALQPHEAAQGQGVDRVFRLTALDAEELRGKADAELQYLHVEQLGGDEVSELVHDYEHDQHGNKGQNG